MTISHPDAEDRRAILLASMRVARSNLGAWMNELDAIGIALKAGAIEIDAAIEWLDELGVLTALPTVRQADRERAA